MPESPVIIFALIVSLIFVFVHLSSHKIYGFSKRYKKKILSFSGGVASAYVFLDLLPLIENADPHLHAILGNTPLIMIFLEKAIFGVAFIGFLVFFILEYLALKSRGNKAQQTTKSLKETNASKNVFFLHISLTAVVSLIICYSLRFEILTTGLGVAVYTIALSLHFFISDRSMEEHYGALYVKYGRYLLALMPILGWSLSILFPERTSEAYVLLAFIAGAVLFNVIKDEVPRVGTGKPISFFTGALLYSGLILVLPWIH
ncbi:hypothetical protein [Methanobacterium sp. MBAC-LM]|jgi:hypothetical protein|uniref:hypothetical protein n=1 Tax=Methanobacterium sp. MBAC-LM TaxID=3412034 RepID=UPI003C7682F0